MRNPRIILIGYSLASNSLRELQKALRDQFPNTTVLRVDKDSKTYVYRKSDRIICWGITNHPLDTFNVQKKVAANKLKTFEIFEAFDQELNYPVWTTDANIAAEWGVMYLARTELTGHSGQGIVLVEPGQEPPAAPLYVQYKKKLHEYRVHVFGGKVIDITQKRKRKEVPNDEVDYKIRNHKNGWVYCREDIQIPVDLEQQALLAITALGLEFGAVDVIFNSHENRCYVLEVNTAPGLEGTTLVKYIEQFKEKFNAN